MCGIAGFLFKQKRYIDYKEKIEIMIKVQEHRGPDDSGVCFLTNNNGQVCLKKEANNETVGAFGFDRLSIRDISIRAHQPMFNEDQSIGILFNGEIYNTNEIKENYLKNVHFNSTSDTEIILKMYERYGSRKTITLLNGMFAIAIIDMQEKKCFLARDRMGIKPIYCYSGDEGIIFASEVKGIVASGLINVSLNKASFYETILFGYSYQHTLVNNVEELLPGVIREIDVNTIKYEDFNYWDVCQSIMKKANLGGLKKEVNIFEKVLSEAVKNQMVSDVDLGCQLSGGIDSSLISFLLKKRKNDTSNPDKIKLNAIGIIPTDERQSEEQWMVEASVKNNIELRKVKLTDAWIVENWKKAVWHMDGVPFDSCLGVMKIAETARKENLTVLLSGEGADELFAGYPRMSNGLVKINLATICGKLHIDKEKFEKKTGISLFCWGMNPDRKNCETAYMLYSADALDDSVLYQTTGIHKLPINKEIIGRRIQVINNMDKCMSLLDKMRCFDIQVRLPALLVRQDKMTMAFSIENRVPFLDNNVINYALKLRKNYLISKKNRMKNKVFSGGQGKYIVKLAAKKIYGSKFVYRKKVGFSMPIINYVKAFAASEDYEEIIKKIRKRNLYDASFLDRIIKKIDVFSYEYAVAVWRLISLEIFCEEFIDPFEGEQE